MHKYKIKRINENNVDVVIFTGDLISKNYDINFNLFIKAAILLTIWHIFTQIRPYELHSPENSVIMVAVPMDNLPIFTKKQEPC